MERKIRFTTLFYHKIKNVHLKKDVGMIPYMFYKVLNTDSELVTIKSKENYESLNREVKGLKHRLINPFIKIPLIKIYPSAIFFILKNGRSIDIFNLYHFNFSTIIYGFVYKTVNPRGVLYIKADISEESFLKLFSIEPKTIFGKFRTKAMKRFIATFANIVSYESKSIKKLIEKYFPKCSNKFVYLPNGIDNTDTPERKPFFDKENIIIWVGRVGNREKNTEYFLKAISHINLKNWKVYIIGPIEEHFSYEIEKFYKNNPKYKSNVFFKGNMNKIELYSFYNRAKVFCLTSPKEGFPLVYPEALYYCNYILTTNVGGASDITNNSQIGKVVNNKKEFRDQLERIIDDEVDLSNNYKLAKKYSKNFIWSKIIKQNSSKFL